MHRGMPLPCHVLGKGRLMTKCITGNESVAYGVLLSRPKVICAYPITPQSRIPELLSEFCAQGLLDARFVNAESEAGSIGYVAGASAGGVRVFTATSSQGLALMHEELHWIAGSRLPVVMAVVNRSLGAPGNISTDLIDSLSQRDTGWMQFYCESNQEVLDTVIQAYKISESVSLPSMVCLEGVYLSYVAESVDIPEQERVDEYLPPYDPKARAPWGYKMYFRSPTEATIDPGLTNPTDGAAFMRDKYQLHKLESKCLDAFMKANDKFHAVFGRGYPPVDEYRCNDANTAVVMAGSSAGTCRDVIDRLREEGYKVGMVKLKMFRPFPKELVTEALANREKIIVIERDLSPGQCGIFYQEIKWALQKDIPMYGFVCGLGGGDITPELIEKAVLFAIRSEPPQQEVIWLGLRQEARDDYDRSTIRVS